MSTTVLYIAGTGRSGSTVLANVLGEVDGFFAAGEVRFLWQRGLIENRLCGCGIPVAECPVWTAVLATAARGGAAIDPQAMVGRLGDTGRIRHLPRMVSGRLLPGLDPTRGPAAAPAREALAALYPAIAEVTSSRVIVDSSKLPAYANLLAATPGIDLRVVHLVRDPRGAAHSWASRKALTDGASRPHMENLGPAKSSMLWDVWNVAAGVLFDTRSHSYLRLRYEDFVADPAAALARILAMAGTDPAQTPTMMGGTIHLNSNHSVAGNPDRLRNGIVHLRADTRWLTDMPRRDRRLVAVTTAPLLLRYGYPLTTPRAPAVDSAAAETIFDRAPANERPTGRLVRKVRRHLRWGRTEGFGRLVEEDELNPITRARVAADKRRWRRAHPQPAGRAIPVYLVGLQRSGTNMLARGLDTAPEFEVRNENDRTAFHLFQLRSDEVVQRIVLASRHRYVLFKPLCDSHRIDHLLDDVSTPSAGRAIWAYRDVDGRVRSAVSKFGRNNLLVLGDIAAGRGSDMWQAQRLSAETLGVLSSFDYRAMTPESAAALMWWMRNGLYFELGLERRDDVMLASYQDLLHDPPGAMGALCSFLDLPYRPGLVAHLRSPSSGHRPRLDVDPRVRALCDQLAGRLDDVHREQRRKWAA
ncbi:MAG: sulfotransferase [Candidatus Dormibacteraeota bacterium]|nr:sulfotransferase [Candidatus Dormibacteraeota bacterium]